MTNPFVRLKRMANQRSIKNHDGRELGEFASRDLCQAKYFVLSLLVVQNTAYVLILRHSRTRPGTMYLSSTAVCCVEALKMLVCFGITTVAYSLRHRNQSVDGGGEYSMINMKDIDVAASSSDDEAIDVEDVEKISSINPSRPISSHAASSDNNGTNYADYGDKSSDINASQPIYGHESLVSYLRKQLQFDYRLAVIAGVFTIQNNLLFLALTNLDAAVFQVAYQLKVLATALFSVLLLKKKLSRQQVVALVLLSTGVALLELDRTENATPPMTLFTGPDCNGSLSKSPLSSIFASSCAFSVSIWTLKP